MIENTKGYFKDRVIDMIEQVTIRHESLFNILHSKNGSQIKIFDGSTKIIAGFQLKVALITALKHRSIGISNIMPLQRQVRKRQKHTRKLDTSQ